MKVRKSSLTYRAVNYIRPAEVKGKPMSVCEYYGNLMYVPFFWILVGLCYLIAGLTSPIWWPLFKLDAKFFKDKKCPFGNIEVVE